MLVFIILIFTSCSAGNLTNKEDNIIPTPSMPPSQAPSTATKREISLRFVVMADSRGSNGGINTDAIKRTFESIKKTTPQPLFAVMPGDLVEGADSYSQEKSQLQDFKDKITKYYPISFFYPGFGNHEATASESGEQAFEMVFSEFKANFLEGYHKTVYYFDSGNARFYMLNSNHPAEEHIISNKQLNWIEANKDPGKKENFYFFHEPAFPTGAHVGSSLDVNKLQRDSFWEIIDHSENPMVFCGHEHNYSRRHIDSDFGETINNQVFKFTKQIFQVTTGSFGAPVYTSYIDKKNVDVPPIPEYHYAIVDVNEGKIKVNVYNLNGKVIDSFEQ